MTATVETGTTARRTRSAKGAVVISPWPQVNLLPPEVRASRALRVVKRWLAIVLVVAILASAGVVAFAILAQRGADRELADAGLRTEQLNAERSKYADVPLVLAAVDATKLARTRGTSTEVIWTPYLQAIAATAPAGVSVSNISVVSPWPAVTGTTTGSPFAAPGVGTITFTARSLTVPDTAAWLDGLETVPGFADAWFSDATRSTDAVTFYEVSGTVQLTEQAWALRFADATKEN